eukprot:m.431951 g.431951  ORF g.431951 m.431951 type:complete len:1240 (-) comp17373_c0_seq1:1509-5228(-)
MLGGTDEVMAAVRGGEMANVVNFLENTDAKKAVQLSDEWGNSMLHYAANAGNLDMVTVLLAHAASPDVQSTDGLSPLHLASYAGHKAVVMQLVEQGASVHLQDTSGRTARQMAVDGGHLECAQFLSECLETESPLGSEPDPIGQSGVPLGPEPDIVVLDKPVADPEALDRIVAACSSGDTDTLISELARDFPPDLSTVGDQGDTPVHAAIRAGHTDIFRLLVIHGGSPFSRNEPSHRTCLHVAVEEGHAEAVVVLIREFGLPLDATDSCGMTAIHIAAAHGRRQMLQSMLWAHQATLTQMHQLLLTPDQGGRTAAAVAAWSSHTDCAALLQRYQHMCRAVAAGPSALAASSEYIDAIFKQRAYCQLEPVLNDFIKMETGAMPKSSDIQEGHLLVLRLFLAGTQCTRRRAGVPDLPEDTTAEPAELATAVLDMLTSEREAHGVAPGDAESSGQLWTGGVDKHREAKASILAESCIYAARAIAEHYEFGGVLMAGIAMGDGNNTHSRDLARLHVIKQVRQGKLSEDGAAEILENLEELEAFTEELAKMGPEVAPDKGKGKKENWASALLTKSVKLLKGDFKGDDKSSSNTNPLSLEDLPRAVIPVSDFVPPSLEELQDEPQSVPRENEGSRSPSPSNSSSPDVAVEAQTESRENEGLQSSPLPKSSTDLVEVSPKRPVSSLSQIDQIEGPKVSDGAENDTPSNSQPVTCNVDVNIRSEDCTNDDSLPNDTHKESVEQLDQPPAQEEVDNIRETETTLLNTQTIHTTNMVENPAPLPLRAQYMGYPLAKTPEPAQYSDEERQVEVRASSLSDGDSGIPGTPHRTAVDFLDILSADDVRVPIDTSEAPVDLPDAIDLESLLRTDSGSGSDVKTKRKSRKATAKRKTKAKDTKKEPRKRDVEIGDAVESPTRSLLTPEIENPGADAISNLESPIRPSALLSKLSDSFTRLSDSQPEPINMTSEPPSVVGADTGKARFTGEDHLIVGNTAYPCMATPSDSPVQLRKKPAPVSTVIPISIMCSENGSYGVEFFPGEGGGVVVKDISRGSPADLAGLCVSDVLVVVDGRDANTVPLAEVLELMRSKRGKEPIRFDVSRTVGTSSRVRSLYQKDGTGTRIVTIPRIRGVGGMGFSLTKNAETEEIVVKEVVPGGAADTAGLQDNDIVLAASGRNMNEFKSLIEVFRFFKMLKDSGTVLLRIERQSAIVASLQKLKNVLELEKKKDPLAGAPSWWADPKHSPTAVRKSK